MYVATTLRCFKDNALYKLLLLLGYSAENEVCIISYFLKKEVDCMGLCGICVGEARIKSTCH